jgi:hypothetical protein
MIQEKIDIANKIAQEISLIEGVMSSCVDDYNKYGDFQVVVYLDLNKNKKPKNNKFNLRKINNEIKKILENAQTISKFSRNIDSPKRLYDKYTYRNLTDLTFIGYEKSYIMVDFIVTLEQEKISITELLHTHTI